LDPETLMDGFRRVRQGYVLSMLELLRSDPHLQGLWEIFVLVAEQEPCTVEQMQTIQKTALSFNNKRLKRLWTLELLERTTCVHLGTGGRHFEYRVSRFGREVLAQLQAMQARAKDARRLTREAS